MLNLDGNPLVSPPKKVVDLGVEAVREYLGARINRGESKKKRSFIRRMFVRCGSMNVKGGRVVAGREEEEEDVMLKYKMVEGFATPMREVNTVRSPIWTALSPKRLFGSPRK